MGEVKVLAPVQESFLFRALSIVMSEEYSEARFEELEFVPRGTLGRDVRMSTVKDSLLNQL